MKYVYFLTYTLNILILCLIFIDVLKLEQFNYLIADNYLLFEKHTLKTILFLLYVSVTILNLPITPFITIYSSTLFGVSETIVYIFFASCIGAYLSLIVNRYFNKKVKFISNTLSKMNLLFKPSTIHIILLKIIPIIPFSWVIIYVSNTNFSSKYFLLGYSIGTLVPITLTANLGKAIIDENLYMFSIIIFTLILLSVLGKYIKNYNSKKNN